MQLSELVKLIKSHWPFDYSKYPRLSPHADAGDQLHFAANHIYLQLGKTQGLFAKICHDSDHNGTVPDREALKQVVADMLIHTLCLSDVIGFPAEEIESRLSNWAAEAARRKAKSGHEGFRTPEPPMGTG